MMRLEKRGIVHSRMILGSFLMYLQDILKRDVIGAIESIIESLLPFSEDIISKAATDIIETVEEIFWEVGM